MAVDVGVVVDEADAVGLPVTAGVSVEIAEAVGVELGVRVGVSVGVGVGVKVRVPVTVGLGVEVAVLLEVAVAVGAFCAKAKTPRLGVTPQNAPFCTSWEVRGFQLPLSRRNREMFGWLESCPGSMTTQSHFPAESATVVETSKNQAVAARYSPGMDTNSSAERSLPVVEPDEGRVLNVTKTLVSGNANWVCPGMGVVLGGVVGV